MRGQSFCCPHAPYYIGKFANCQEVFRKYTELFRGGGFFGRNNTGTVRKTGENIIFS